MKYSGKQIALTLLVTLTLAFAGAAYTFKRAISTQMNIGPGGYELVLRPGATMNSIAKELVRENIIASPLPLIWYARLTGQAHRIQAGEYLLGPETSGIDLVAVLVSGRVIQLPVTLVEGSSFNDVLKVLSVQPRLVSKTSGMNYHQIMAALGMEGISPEGRFFPDTYLYAAGTTDLELLKRSAVRMQDVLMKEWLQRDPELPYENIEQALVMASMIEKETGSQGERSRVAGVFVRRLKLGMRLQSDPTVIFGMGDRYKGNITRADLKRRTPYNTYRIDGLPPTPIGLPGRASIMAALHPAPGNELYFVGKGDGSHHFSATLAQHQKAVEQYQRSGRRKDYRSHPINNAH